MRSHGLPIKFTNRKRVMRGVQGLKEHKRVAEKEKIGSLFFEPSIGGPLKCSDRRRKRCKIYSDALKRVSKALGSGGKGGSKKIGGT